MLQVVRVVGVVTYSVPAISLPSSLLPSSTCPPPPPPPLPFFLHSVCSPLPMQTPEEGNAQRQALTAEHDQGSYQMEDLYSSSIVKAVRNLLMPVPTDSRKMQAMEVFSPQAGGGASDDSQGNLASPQCSKTALLDQWE